MTVGKEVEGSMKNVWAGVRFRCPCSLTGPVELLLGAEWPCRAPWQPHRTATGELRAGGTLQLISCGLHRKETFSHSGRWRKGEERQVWWMRLAGHCQQGPIPHTGLFACSRTSAPEARLQPPPWREAQMLGLGYKILGCPRDISLRARSIGVEGLPRGCTV